MNVNQLFSGARVYRRELWRDVQFPDGRVYEDSATIPLLYTRARTLHQLSDELYYYRRRHGSITQNATLHTVGCLTLSAEEALARCDGGRFDAYWLVVFAKLFRQACLQVSKTDTATFEKALQMIRATESRYDDFIARRGHPPRLAPRWKIYADRFVFQGKAIARKALGRQLRPLTVQDWQ